ncbi:MAG: ROK family protein [Anaerolineae bacterium]
MLVLGLDFGGTKLAAGVWRVGSAQLLATRRRPTDVAAGAEGDLAAMLDMSRDLLASVGGAEELSAVGVCFGGQVDAARGVVIVQMHVPGWEMFPLRDTMAAHFGVPAAVENDGNAAALAEHRFGAGRGRPSLLYLTVSTGVGGGLVLDGRIFEGAHGLAGEIGHMLVAPGGPPCPCGRRGCLEAVAAGPAIARAAVARLAANPEPRSALRGLPSLTARNVAEAAAGGDDIAREVLDEAFGYLGLGVANAAVLLDPGCVVLGGGVTRMGEPLFERVRAAVQERVFAPCDVLPARLGDDVGIWGGVAVAPGVTSG